MYSLLFAIVLLISSVKIHAFQYKNHEIYLGDQSYLVKNPVHSKSELGFSGYNYPSSEEGICKALGFEKAAKGSLRSSNTKYNSITVNDAGSVIGGPVDYTVTQIVCLNKVDFASGEKSYLVVKPIHNNSLLGFSGYNYPSSEDGVCKALGFEKAAKGSLRSSNTKYNSITVNDAGSVIGAPVDYTITQIVCLNKTTIVSNEKSLLILNPQHPESLLGFSGYNFRSSEDGVCKALGFEKAAKGSLRSSNTKYNSITVNDTGSVIGGPVDYTVTQIVCLTYR